MSRHVRPADFAAIGGLVTQAFGRPQEADLVARLRAEGDVILEMVEADALGGLVAHVLYSRLWSDHRGLFAALAPLSVHPDWQGGGSGSRLASASLLALKEYGVDGVLVLGNPAYYSRFGFRTELAARVASPYSETGALMALELTPGAFADPMTVAYPSAFAA